VNEIKMNLRASSYGGIGLKITSDIEEIPVPNKRKSKSWQYIYYTRCEETLIGAFRKSLNLVLNCNFNSCLMCFKQTAQLKTQ
jgi:hypothetical protein